MTYPRRRAAGQIASLLVAVGLGTVTVAACGHSEQPKPTGSSSAQAQPAPTSSASAAPAAKYDISRVESVKNDLPPGFKPDLHPEQTLRQEDITGVEGIIPFAQAKFDPPQCRELVIPPYADPSVGTQAAGVAGEGDQGQIFVVAMRLPQPIPASQPPAGCDHVSLSGAPDATGTAEPIPAPKIDGVTTTGAKLNHTDQNEDPDYVFTAALGNQTSVVVMGNADEQLNPQQLLSDLLVKATSAVRGQ